MSMKWDVQVGYECNASLSTLLACPLSIPSLGCDFIISILHIYVCLSLEFEINNFIVLNQSFIINTEKQL